MTDIQPEGQKVLAFIERVENVTATIKDEQEARKEIYAEAKGEGYSVKALKQLVKLRTLDPSKRLEEKQILEIYADAIGVEV